MSVQTMSGVKSALRVSRMGSGKDHYHLIVSKTTGVNGATVARSYDVLSEASAKAEATLAAFKAEGYTSRTRQSNSVMEVSKDDVTRFIFVRPCNLRHSR